MNRIVVGNYNNYYNRIHKPAQSTVDLYTNVGAPLTVDRMWDVCQFDNINFVRGDNLESSLTINVSENPDSSTEVINPSREGMTASQINPDYLLVCDGTTVVSRWFIIEAVWNREWQFKLTLRRDLLADFWDAISSVDFYCEKGPIPANYDVAKYNSEGQTFNQELKKRIQLLPEEGQTDRYIIGYMDKTWKGGEVIYGDVYADYKSKAECPLFDENGSLKKFDSAIGVRFQVRFSDQANGNYQTPQIGTGYLLMGYWDAVDYSFDGGTVIASSNVLNVTGRQGITEAEAISVRNYIANTCSAQVVPAVINEFYLGGFYPITTEISSMNNKLIRVGDTFYTVTITNVPRNDTPVPTYKGWFPIFDSIVYEDENNYIEDFNPDMYNPKSLNLYLTHTESYVTLTPYAGTTYSFYQRNHIDEVPYDIFVMPDNVTTRKLAGYLASQYIRANVIYDIQVLPFKPSVTETNRIQVGAYYLRWATDDYVHGTFYHDAVKTYSGSLAYKKGSNMDLCRLYSPDGSSCWEFNPAKIGGVPARSIKYEVTFAPLRPYIHIFPTFGGIYGSVNKTLGDKTGESRGLLCSGDYSIPYSSSNWATYQLNNSAYQFAHDRQIQNMSIMQDAERKQELFNILTGTFTGAFSGASAGFMAGGGYGAAAGAIVGGAGSLAGGLVSRQVNEQLRKEEISYAEDMFGYSLRNIQAQAQPLGHSNYLTIGVSYFPYIELYGATSTEETIFENRLRINGWSLGIVTTLAAVKTAATASGANTRFAKGTIVKFDGYEDGHIANAINTELQRGVRFLES